MVETSREWERQHPFESYRQSFWSEQPPPQRASGATSSTNDSDDRVMQLEEARQLLSIAPSRTLSRTLVRRAWMQALRVWHPDHAAQRGLTHEEATARSQQVNAAKERLMAEVAAQDEQ